MLLSGNLQQSINCGQKKVTLAAGRLKQAIRVERGIFRIANQIENELDNLAASEHRAPLPG